MGLQPIAARCPLCGSLDVVYSCTPLCCFNHVCADCRASWQHRTVVRAAADASVDLADPGEYDASLPSAPCALCGGLVFQIDATDALWCPRCGRALQLEHADIRPWAS